MSVAEDVAEDEETASVGEDEGHRMSLATPKANSRPAAFASSPAKGLPIKMPGGTTAEQSEAAAATLTSAGGAMLSGKVQREAAKKLADLRAKPLDDSAKLAIAEHRALSAERHAAAQDEAAKRGRGMSELEARLARRGAISDGMEPEPVEAPADAPGPGCQRYAVSLCVRAPTARGAPCVCAHAHMCV